MAPKDWDEEESDSSTPPAARRGKFDDEEEDSDVVDSWDAADDSEAEREKAKKEAEAKAKAEAAKKAAHKTKTERIAQHKEDNLRRKQALEESSDEDEDEDEDERRARLRREQKEADLRHAEDLFGDLNIASNNTRSAPRPVTLQSSDDPTNVIDLSSLPIFSPTTKDQFVKLREALVPLLSANAKKAPYSLFMQEFTKQICKELPSDQIKKIASGLTTLSNEKMKEEKAAEKGGKKSKAAKTKTSLVASRDVSSKADLQSYDDGLDEDDFM